MTIENFTFISPTTGAEYILTGTIEHYPSSGFTFTRITHINGEEEDSITLRQLIKHEDILEHIKKLNNI